MDLTEKKIISQEIFKGRVLHLVRDTVELPNGRITTREVARHPGAVLVVPLTEDNEVVMVRQYRYPFQQVLLEVPAGKLDPGEAPEACARRELSEETGVEAGKLMYLGEYLSSVAILDERIHMYLARDLIFREAHTDEGKFLTVERIPIQTLYDRLMAGEIRDGKTQTAILKTWCLLQGAKTCK